MKRIHTLIIIFLLLLAMASLGPVLLANTANGYGLSWLTVDGGGGTSQGGQYRASITIGQGDTAVMAGGGYKLTGGFWVFGPVERFRYMPFIARP